MNKIRRSFALCASVATFMHGSAEKIYKSHILRTATITRTSSTRSLTVQAQNLYAESFQKTSLECWCKIPPISARSCGMIVWDHQHFTRSLGSRSLSYCMCYAKTVRGSWGHVRAAPAVQNWRSRPMPATWNNASTMRHTRGNHDHFKSTQSTHATQNNENILAAGMHNPCKAAQLNHIDRCDCTLHTLPVTPLPRPRSLENYFVEKYLKRI